MKTAPHWTRGLRLPRDSSYNYIVLQRLTVLLQCERGVEAKQIYHMYAEEELPQTLAQFVRKGSSMRIKHTLTPDLLLNMRTR